MPARIKQRREDLAESVIPHVRNRGLEFGIGLNVGAVLVEHRRATASGGPLRRAGRW
jgi:hypothetical protein